jgi:hypothetical protein
MLVQGRLGIAPLHQDLAERSLIDHRHAFARRTMLGRNGVEPGATAPAVLHFRRLADAREPVRPFPPHLVAEGTRGAPSGRS